MHVMGPVSKQFSRMSTLGLLACSWISQQNNQIKEAFLHIKYPQNEKYKARQKQLDQANQYHLQHSGVGLTQVQRFENEDTSLNSFALDDFSLIVSKHKKALVRLDPMSRKHESPGCMTPCCARITFR